MTASFSDSGSVIVAGARTPTGRFRGALSSLPATELGAVAIRAALERSHIPPASVGYVIMGQVVTAGAGQNPARIAAIEAGIPMSVPAITINKVCLSGIDAIILADQLVRAGDYDMVVVGGMESMSRAPHLPSGFGYGDVLVHDALELDGLRDYFHPPIDGGAHRSRERAARRCRPGRAGCLRRGQPHQGGQGLEGQPVRRRSGAGVRAQRRGEPLIVTKDEGIRTDVTAASLAGLRPSFRTDGTITAGSSSRCPTVRLRSWSPAGRTPKSSGDLAHPDRIPRIRRRTRLHPCNCNPPRQSKRPVPEAECSQQTWT